MITIIIEFLKHFLKFLVWRVYDIYLYYRERQWEIFDGFGLHIYVGLFGSGKTSSMVRDAYQIAKQFPQVTILTNMKLLNFPKHTRILKLDHYKQIIEAPANTLILLDEISSIFNSRAWEKEGIPAPLLSMLLQVRKERKMIYATAQRFNHVDALIRQITFSVRECKCWFGRWNWIRVFDAFEYENSNVMKPAICLDLYSFIQTNKIRKLYDTFEMIEKMKKEDYMTDKEILERQGTTNSIIVAAPQEKKKQKFKLL